MVPPQREIFEEILLQVSNLHLYLGAVNIWFSVELFFGSFDVSVKFWEIGIL